MSKAIMYHGQATIDKEAKTNDRRYEIPSASIKAIKEAYKEFLDDLLLESQEAY